MDNNTLVNETVRFSTVLDVIIELAGDEEIKEKFMQKDGKGIFKAASLAMKRYPEKVVELILAYEDKTAEESDLNFNNVFKKLLKILNDKEFMGAFTFAE